MEGCSHRVTAVALALGQTHVEDAGAESIGMSMQEYNFRD